MFGFSDDIVREIPDYISKRAKVLSHVDDIAPKIIKSIEKSIKNKKYEHGFFMNENKGFKPLKTFTSNSEDYINISQAFGNKLKRLDKQRRSSLKNSILTHNHPNNSSLSSADFEVFLNLGLKEIRAVGKNSTVHSLRLKKGVKMTTSFRNMILKSLKKKRKEWQKEYKLNLNNLEHQYLLQNLEEVFLLDKLEDKVNYVIFY